MTTMLTSDSTAVPTTMVRPDPAPSETSQRPTEEPKVAPAATPWMERIDWPTLVRRGLLGIALTGVAFVVWLVVFSGLAFDRSQSILAQQFDTELRDGIAPVNQPIEPGSPIAVLEVPALGMRQVVVEGSTSAQTATGPGHLRTSGFPGQPGVSILFGHRAAYGGVFGMLPQLARNDLIIVTTGQGESEYKVTDVATFAADDAAAFVSDGDALKLVTSDPGLIASKRLVVTAEPVGDLYERGARVPQASPSPAELGLGGDSGAAVGLLVWLEVALVVFAAALWLSRRWHRWPAWVVSAPLLVAVVWILFEQFALLLPATL